MKLHELNQELASIKQIQKTINVMQRYKNKPFQTFKIFWDHTKDVQTQEEFTRKMNEGIEKGMELIKIKIIELTQKLEKESVV